MKHTFERYCKNYQSIENYEKAKADNFKGWHCHHRLETHTSDGERRLVDITQKELIALGMYYHRPAEELIFLASREHNAFKKGKHLSTQTRKKLSEVNKGKTLSAEHKKKLSEAHKGHCVSEEAKKKLREAHLGQIPWNKGKHTQPKSDETRRRMSESHKGKNTWSKGMHWYNNGKENKYCYECPDGFTPGRLL